MPFQLTWLHDACGLVVEETRWIMARTRKQDGNLEQKGAHRCHSRFWAAGVDPTVKCPAEVAVEADL